MLEQDTNVVTDHLRNRSITDLIAIPNYLFDKFKKCESSVDIQRVLMKLSDLDRNDFTFFNNVFSSFLLELAGIKHIPTHKEVVFEKFVDQVVKYGNILEMYLRETDLRDYVRDQLSNITMSNSQDVYDKIEQLNMKTLNAEDLSKFVTIKLVGTSLFIVFQPYFLNLLIKDPLKVILLLQEGVLNLLVRNLGEATINDTSGLGDLGTTIKLLKNSYTTLLFLDNDMK